MGTQVEKCSLCGQTREWHDQNKPKHKFNGQLGEELETQEGLPASAARPSGRGAGGAFGDAVLRLALCKAGVINQLQLEEARVWADESHRLGKALVVEPDPETPGGFRYRLVEVEELASQVAKEAVKQ